jgi:pyruvate kinase
MVVAGMNVARLNFSHGDFASHGAVIERLRAAARLAGTSITIMADLPGPKIRIGMLTEEPVDLRCGDLFTLTTADICGDRLCASVNFPRLPSVVKAGDILFLNDGVIHLEVTSVDGADIHCRVSIGGELRSRKGLNLPGIDLGSSAFTNHDQDCLKFALAHGVDAISQSFVETAEDIDAVRGMAAELGYQPFIFAKIERAGALTHIDTILAAADGIMIARGDLGVETPIECIALVQKHLIEKANRHGKPVITATQMLESMVEHCRPTRAEATDVANAILDGTDCVMLSEESAMGKYPVAAVAMLVKIAAATEPYRTKTTSGTGLTGYNRDGDNHLVDLISRNVQQTVLQLAPSAVIVPTASGYTARMVSRFKLPVWIVAVSLTEAVCRGLQFSYGVVPVLLTEHPPDWNIFAAEWLRSTGLPSDLVVLTEGTYRLNPQTNPRMEIIDLRHDTNAMLREVSLSPTPAQV